MPEVYAPPQALAAVDAVFPDLSEPIAAGSPPPVLLVGRDVDESAPVVVVELCAFEPLAGKEFVVPVTSMRCPLWLFSSVSCPSRTYVVFAHRLRFEAPSKTIATPRVVHFLDRMLLHE